ncbi:MAG: hypothetical protein QXQ41_07230, partial [Candidatus Bathyarchaeia archaeon]
FWFTACGAGCCGGQWKLEVDVFSNFGGDPGLFGITRIDALLNVPVMANLVADFYISIAKLDCTVPACTPSGIRAPGGGFTLNF